MPTVLNCTRCGEPMPPLPDDLAKMLANGAAVTVTHETCGDAPTEPAGRSFAVRVAIVEVVETDGRLADASGALTIPQTIEEELAAFRATATAPNLDAAMRPLAEALGVEWLKVEKHAGIADPRA